ncbi:hypothetical protein E2C01_012599 [Portunus trituberculatus]|uniref:Uncharacterized protein n=1 Tax=Portunus trituberculatus TaxID=210409 RepID=A0A5B7DEI6_PORTR|nr:hypothetical protein [Portunus trituberculatus]
MLAGTRYLCRTSSRIVSATAGNVRLVKYCVYKQCIAPTLVNTARVDLRLCLLSLERRPVHAPPLQEGSASLEGLPRTKQGKLMRYG